MYVATIGTYVFWCWAARKAWLGGGGAFCLFLLLVVTAMQHGMNAHPTFNGWMLGHIVL
jgi:hypothetical protein